MDQANQMAQLAMYQTPEYRKQANGKYYAKKSSETYTCEYCNKTIKAVSKKAHEQGSAHLRMKVLAERYYDQALPKLDARCLNAQLQFSEARAVRSREESALERETQNAYYNVYNNC